MKRRECCLPEWTRTIWASQTAKEVWEPRIARIGVLTATLEISTVENGQRRAAWIYVGSEDLQTRQDELAERGLTVIPIHRQGITGSYSASGLPYEERQPYNWRCLVAQLGIPSDQLEGAFREGNDEMIGEALGYPKCCRDFFARVWVREQWLDTTWPMAEKEGEATDVTTLRFEVIDRWPANILGRWAGVRAVPWLPCSFICGETVQAWRDLWEPLAHGIDEEALEWLETLLCASWRWSALHGIAEIEMSIFKVSTRTDTCDDLHVVEYAGAELEAGATGTRFPFHVPKDPQLTKGKSFAAGLKALETSDPDSKLWEQNGFASLEGMASSHDVLLRALEEGYEPTEDFGVAKARGYIMDPGCGNGIFLEKLGDRYPWLLGCGIECMRDRAIAAYERLPVSEEERIVFGSLALLDNWRGREYDLVLMMPGRLLELEAVERAGVLYYLKMHARRLLVYAYGVPGHENLESFVEAAGLLKDWQGDFSGDSGGVVFATVCCPRVLSA